MDSARLRLSQITRGGRAWPRQALDAARVTLFVELLHDDRDALPPLIVVDDRNGAFILADGHHRAQALEQLDAGHDLTHVDIRQAPAGRAPEDHAYELALEHSAKTSVPLTQAEKRAAIRRLLAEHPDWSVRAIARTVGVSHTTVTTVKEAPSSARTATPPAPGASPAASSSVSASTRAAQSSIRAGYRLDELDEPATLVASELLAEQDGDTESAMGWAEWQRNMWADVAAHLRR